jgi:outer membrane protein TolC
MPSSITAAKLIPLAGQEVASAEEALRLTQQNLRTGTGLMIDVLQAEDTAEKARLRRGHCDGPLQSVPNQSVGRAGLD